MQRVVKVGLGARALALRPETRRLPAAPSAYCAEDKENDGLMPSAVLRAVSPGVVGKTASGALDELPVTPVRARAALRSLSAEDEPPSPTTSTELSPLGQELMANVREQRMRAREREKVEGRRRHEGGRARSKTPVLA